MNSQLLYYDNKLFELTCICLIYYSKMIQPIKNSISHIFQKININLFNDISSNEVISFLSMNFSTVSLFKFFLYNYEENENEYFFIFLFKLIGSLFLTGVACILEEYSSYLHHRTGLIYRAIGSALVIINEFLEPIARYHYLIFTNKCSNNFIKKVTQNILDDKCLLENMEDTLSNIQTMIKYGSYDYNEDCFHKIIKFGMALIIRTILMLIDTIKYNFHRILLIRVISLLSVFGLQFSNLSYTLVGKFNKNIYKKETEYINNYSESYLFIENIIQCKDTLYSSMLTDTIMDELSLKLKYNSESFNTYVHSLCFDAKKRNLPSYFIAFINMFFFKIVLSPTTLVLQDRTVKDTSANWHDLRKIVYIFNHIQNKYNNKYNMTTDLERKYEQFYIKYTGNAPKTSIKIDKIESIHLDHICFSYSTNKINIPIFQNMSINIKPGLTIILGKSGQGKTTLLNLLSGIMKIQSGRILVNNQIDIQDLTDYSLTAKNYISVMSQRTYLFEKQSILFNITFQNKLSLKEEQVLTTILELCDLTSLVHKKGLDYSIHNHPSNLSEGQKKRLSLAQTLYEFELFSKSVLMIDEPTTGLEPASSQSIINNLKKYYSNTSKLIILGMHPGIINTEDNHDSNIHYIKLK